MFNKPVPPRCRRHSIFFRFNETSVSFPVLPSMNMNIFKHTINMLIFKPWFQYTAAYKTLNINNAHSGASMKLFHSCKLPPHYETVYSIISFHQNGSSIHYWNLKGFFAIHLSHKTFHTRMARLVPALTCRITVFPGSNGIYFFIFQHKQISH